jgi:hypothetical protein
MPGPMPDRMMLVLGDLFGDVLGGLVGRGIGDRTRRRRQGERARSGRYPAHIRLAAGSEPGLFPWWQAGEVTLAQGVMRFGPVDLAPPSRRRC